MQESNINILSTRFLEPQLVQEMEENNIKVDIVNFIQTFPIVDASTILKIEQTIKTSSNVIFTSTNAINAIEKIINNKIPNWKIACIAATTYKKAVTVFGESSILAKAESAKELASKILMHKEIKELYFFCGDRRRKELPQLLQNAGVVVNEISVYTTKLTPQKIEQEYNGILFFSPSAVESFFSSNTISSGCTLFAIGNTTANAISNFSKNKIIISDKIDSQHFIATAIALLKQNQ